MLDLITLADQVTPYMIDAGRMIREAWDTNHFRKTKKGDYDVVTDIDIAVENFLRTKLEHLLPHSGFLVEEGTSDRHAEYNWTIDPIDGTKYFAHGVPMFHTQVALIDRHDAPLLAIVYNPMSRQCFVATKGGGSWLNTNQIKPHLNTPLASALINFDFGSVSKPDDQWKFELFQKIASRCYRVRMSAGFLPPYMLTGAIQASINVDVTIPHSIKNMSDVIPHKLLLTEAGFEEQIYDFHGHSFLVWAAPSMQSELKSALNLV